ncbi:hypothetical protein ACQB60_24470 [Actinomycetota bacterium Odt1-20B]
MNRARTVRRIALCASALTLGLTLPATSTNATATDTPAAGTASTVGATRTAGRSGDTHSTVDRVADFYGAYIDVVHDSGRGPLANSLRHHYLTSGLRHSLAAWEAVHHRDGMFRSKATPTTWSVAYNDSGMGHCWTRVDLSSRSPGHHARHTHLTVQSDLATGLISGVRTGW